MPPFDIACIGQNAVDTLILADRYPAHGGKEWFGEEMESPGGQVATAAVACARLGMRTKYIGTLGDDGRAEVQRRSMAIEGIDIGGMIERTGCATQTAYIVIDKSTGERTVLWRRDAALELRPDEVASEWIADARLLHMDAGDLPAAVRCAEIAKALGVPVSLDADTPYPLLDELFPNVDYLIAARGLLETLTGEPDPARAIEITQREFGCRAVGITLGAEGALLRIDGRIHYSPGFVIDTVDTTGAGDVFHGAFCYSVLNEMPIPDALDFANAMAALNCRGYGARGAIACCEEALELMRTGRRRFREGVR
jgi:sulfofructose kinase